jgi:hypothetical protein
MDLSRVIRAATSLPEKCQPDGKDKHVAPLQRSAAMKEAYELNRDARSRGLPRNVALLGVCWARYLGWACVPTSAMLVGSLVVAANPTPGPSPAIHEVDWLTSPLDLNLRGLNGERFRFRCPAGKAARGQVLGSGPYTDGSSICAAAVHAGAIGAANGGLVTIEVRPGESHYAASWSHYVQSDNFDGFWSGSFLVIVPTGTDARP